MSRTQYGMIAGIAGAAAAAAWWYTRRDVVARGMSEASDKMESKGEVIFSNTPIASDSLGG